MSLRDTDPEDVDLVIQSSVRDLGNGFNVRRALPSRRRRMVGPFIFFDQMGPATFSSGEGLDVRPHPHIGLATVTYLLEGEILHRDSLGSVQPIRAGEINWMTAGSGIVHSERTGSTVRASGGPLLGLQSWVALPKAYEETPPEFTHYGAERIPVTGGEGVKMTLIAGSWDGLVSPVRTLCDMVYADIALDDAARYRVSAEHVERAIYILSGAVEIVGQTGGFSAGELVVLKPGAEIVLKAEGRTRLMLMGGEPFPEGRHIYWNFVSSSPERIEQAKIDWRAQRFARVPDDDEFIALPDDTLPVHYP